MNEKHSLDANHDNHRFDSRLIRKPQQQPRLQRGLWGMVNVAFWMLMLYLLLPLLTLLLWLLGIRVAWQQLYEYQDHVDPFLLLAAPIILACCALSLIAWAEYNRMRFSGKERRAPVPVISQAQIAADLGAGPEVSQAIGQTRSVVLHMDDQARPASLSAGPLPPR